MDEDRETRLRLLHQRLEMAREDGHEHEIRRIERVMAEVEAEIEAKRARLTWGDDDIAFKRE